MKQPSCRTRFILASYMYDDGKRMMLYSITKTIDNDFVMPFCCAVTVIYVADDLQLVMLCCD